MARREAREVKFHRVDLACICSKFKKIRGKYNIFARCAATLTRKHKTAELQHNNQTCTTRALSCKHRFNDCNCVTPFNNYWNMASNNPDYIAYAYAAVVAAGGMMGYVKKGSLMSGVMGLTFGGLMAFGAYQTSQNRSNFWLSMGLSVRANFPPLINHLWWKIFLCFHSYSLSQ